MGGCQNYGPSLGVHIEGVIDIDVDIDTDSYYGGLSKLWSLFWVLSIIRQLVFRGPKRGT